MPDQNKSIPAMLRSFTPGIFAGLVGIVFIVAALIKTTDMDLFIRQIKAYDILSSHLLIALSAWGFIIIELLLGAGLITGYRSKIVLPATAFILVVFMLVNIYALVTGSTSDCGCFGSILERTPLETIFEDIVLILFIVFAWIMGIKSWFNKEIFPLAILTLFFLAGIFLPILFGFSPLSIIDPETGYGERYIKKIRAIDLEDNDINQGAYLIVLMSTDCLECRDSVFDLDIIADSEDMPQVIALCSNTEDQISEFKQEFQPFYPVLKINETDFYQLLGNGDIPRVTLLKNGELIRVWDNSVPDTGDIENTMNKHGN